MGLIAAGDWLRRAEADLPEVRHPFEVVGAAAPALILAPHPDDESIGCGGLIAALTAAGVPPEVVVLTDGAGSHPGAPGLAARRMAETRAATAMLGLPAGRLRFLGLPDGDLATHADAAVDLLASCFAAAPPVTILASWRHDPHADHAACAAIARRLATALRPAPPVLSYPLWGLAFAHPIPGFPLPDPPRLAAPPRGLRLGIGAQRDAKQRAIAAHASQHMPDIDGVPGFALPPALLALSDRPFELYLREA